MDSIITNCGLTALRKLDGLKSVSVRTLINLAEDNGVKLIPYKVPVKKLKDIELPAIFHANNHFEYIDDIEKLKDFNLTGFILHTKELPFKIVSKKSLSSINGETWVAAVSASVALTASGVQYIVAKKNAKDAEKNRPKYDIPKGYGDNLAIAKHLEAAGLPDSVYNAWKEGIDRNLAYTNQNASDLKSGTIGLAGGVNQANQANAQLQSADAQAKLQGTQMVLGANKDMADQTAIAYQLNTLNPYYEGIAAKQARNGALFQGITNSAMMFASLSDGSLGGGAKSAGGTKTPTTVDASQNSSLNNPYANNASTFNNPNAFQRGTNPSVIGGTTPQFQGNGYQLPYTYTQQQSPYGNLMAQDQFLGYTK